MWASEIKQTVNYHLIIAEKSGNATFIPWVSGAAWVGEDGDERVEDVVGAGEIEGRPSSGNDPDVNKTFIEGSLEDDAIATLESLESNGDDAGDELTPSERDDDEVVDDGDDGTFVAVKGNGDDNSDAVIVNDDVDMIVLPKVVNKGVDIVFTREGFDNDVDAAVKKGGWDINAVEGVVKDVSVMDWIDDNTEAIGLEVDNRGDRVFVRNGEDNNVATVGVDVCEDDDKVFAAELADDNVDEVRIEINKDVDKIVGEKVDAGEETLGVEEEDIDVDFVRERGGGVETAEAELVDKDDNNVATVGVNVCEDDDKVVAAELADDDVDEVRIEINKDFDKIVGEKVDAGEETLGVEEEDIDVDFVWERGGGVKTAGAELVDKDDDADRPEINKDIVGKEVDENVDTLVVIEGVTVRGKVHSDVDTVVETEDVDNEADKVALVNKGVDVVNVMEGVDSRVGEEVNENVDSAGGRIGDDDDVGVEVDADNVVWTEYVDDEVDAGWLEDSEDTAAIVGKEVGDDDDTVGEETDEEVAVVVVIDADCVVNTVRIAADKDGDTVVVTEDVDDDSDKAGVDKYVDAVVVTDGVNVTLWVKVDE